MRCSTLPTRIRTARYPGGDLHHLNHHHHHHHHHRHHNCHYHFHHHHEQILAKRKALLGVLHISIIVIFISTNNKQTSQFRDFCRLFEGFGFAQIGLGKSLGFGFRKVGFEKKSRFRKIWSRKKVSLSVSENLISKKNIGFRNFSLKKKSWLWFWKT